MHCVQPNCPYLHMDVDDETSVDPYSMVPCNLGGMPGGCRWHSNCLPQQEQWEVPRLELELMEHSENLDAAPPLVEGAPLLHLLLFRFADSDRVVVQEDWCSAILDSGEDFLNGRGMEDTH